jgi:hypothetical protein
MFEIGPQAILIALAIISLLVFSLVLPAVLPRIAGCISKPLRGLRLQNFYTPIAQVGRWIHR